MSELSLSQETPVKVAFLIVRYTLNPAVLETNITNNFPIENLVMFQEGMGANQPGYF